MSMSTALQHDAAPAAAPAGDPAPDRPRPRGLSADQVRQALPDTFRKLDPRRGPASAPRAVDECPYS